MPGRKFSGSNNYRYGMNGQEKDDEVFQGAMTAEYWEYDSRLGRRWNTDPVLKVWESPYACFSNNPILTNDVKGLSSNTVTPKGNIQEVSQPAGYYETPAKPQVNAGKLNSPTLGAAVTPGAGGTAIPQNQPTTDKIPVYDPTLPIETHIDGQLNSANSGNTSNIPYKINRGEPNRLYFIDFPNFDITTGVGPVSVSTSGGGGANCGVPAGDFAGSNSGIDYMGNTWGGSRTVDNHNYLVGKDGNTIIKKVTVVVTNDQVTSGVLQANHITVTKYTTDLTKIFNPTSKEKTVDTTIYSMGGSASLDGVTTGVMFPVVGKSNLPAGPYKNPFNTK